MEQQTRRRKIGLRTKLGFASGALEESMILAAAAITMLYYNQVLGVSAALCGTAFLIAAVVDAISDPLVGALSDGVRTRWGRRHPLMLAAALPVALFFYGLYQPPSGLDEQGLFLWLTVTLVGLGIAKDFYALPHFALGAELTDDYHERTSIYGWNSIVGALGTIAIGVIIYAVIFPSSPAFDNGLLDRGRWPVLALFGAVVAFTAVVTCVLTTADQIPYLHQRDAFAARARRRYADAFRELRTNVKGLATNRSYLAVCLCWLVLAISGGVIQVVGTYARLYGFEFTTEQLAATRFITLPGILLSIPLAMYLTRRLDKKLTVVWTIVASCFLVGLPYTLKLVGFFPENDSPATLPLYFVIQALGYIALPIVPIVINSQMVDVADEHELRTGNRAEGLIFSVRLFAVKASNGLGAVLAGIGLELINFPKNARAAELEPSVINGLMFMMGPLYYLIVFGGLSFALMYSIDRRRHESILAQLEARRGAATE
jgi:glycoside/pentoside/hexuronide:cation symporter, GPH family